MGEVVVHLGAACLPAASLAHRCQYVSVELLDLEQFDSEIVEGVVALVEPLEQGLGAAVGLDGGPDDDVGGAQRLDGLAVARVDRGVDPRREVASLGQRVSRARRRAADEAPSAAGRAGSRRREG